MTITPHTPTTNPATTATPQKMVKKRMWLSFETASFLYDAFNVVLLCAAAVGVVATGIVIWTGSLKEAYLRRELAGAVTAAGRATEEAGKANERAAVSEEGIAKANAETAKALEEAAKAKEGAALAEKAASEAKLELARFKEPRTLTPEQQQALADKLIKFKGTPFDLWTLFDSEPIDLMEQIAGALETAKWVRTAAQSGGIVANVPGEPSVGLSITKGVTIEVSPSRRAEWEGAAIALLTALRDDDGIVLAANPLNVVEGSADNALHIHIGRKP